MEKKFRKIKISTGNTKLGRIPNISLPPITTCRNKAPCAQKCYAMKAWRLYSGTRHAWTTNWELFKQDPDSYFEQMHAWIAKKNPEFFRFHVAGDIPSLSYWVRMVELVGRLPDTKFLCFTKNFKLDYQLLGSLPNFTVVLSMWPGMDNTHKYDDLWFHMPRAWCQDGTEKRVPKDALPCPGLCQNCGMCWNLREIKKDVVFKLH